MAPISSAVSASIRRNTTTPTAAAATTSSSTTTSLQDMSAVAAAIALDMKPKVDIAQTQKIKKLVRRNASDKLKLIQMVHDNPILWDSRLPNFKGAEEEKNRAWEHIGKEFNAPGRRVARAFKSLRESYRRELAHVKLMGNGFKPKWSLYEAMDFLRDVIRERKGGSHAADSLAMCINLSAFQQQHQQQQQQHNNNNNLSNNNNNNNNNHNNNNHNNNSKLSSIKLNTLHSTSFNDAALNLSKCSTLSQEDLFYCVKPELDLSTSSTGGGSCNGGSNSMMISTSPQPMPAHQSHIMQLQLHQAAVAAAAVAAQANNDSRVSSTRNDTTQQSNATYDDMDASSLRSGDDDGAGSMRNEQMSNADDCSDEVEELEAIDADFPYPLILDSNSPRGGAHGNGTAKRRRKDMQNGEGGEALLEDDVARDTGTDDDYEDQMLQQHRHIRHMQNVAAVASLNGGLDMPPPQTVREVLNSKFCGFISAKLNSMEDSEADNLMNRILMLLVQTQGNDAK